MMVHHPAARELLRSGSLTKKTEAAPQVALDGVQPEKDKAGCMLDSAADYALNDVRLQAVASVQEWAETDAADLDADESMADRLWALLIGVADSNKDGEISDDEAAIVEVAATAAFDYLVAKGVSEEDADLVLNQTNAEAADRVVELLRGTLPEGDDAAMEDVNAFVFDADSQADVFDSVISTLDSYVQLDAVYKKVLAVRGGKRVRIKKRVSGTVRLTAKQKVAIVKARRKSHSATARISRMKSLRIRSRAGMGA